MALCSLIIAFIFAIELIINVVPSSAAGRLLSKLVPSSPRLRRYLGRRPSQTTPAPPAPLALPESRARLAVPEKNSVCGFYSFGEYYPNEKLMYPAHDFTLRNPKNDYPGELHESVNRIGQYKAKVQFPSPIEGQGMTRVELKSALGDNCGKESVSLLGWGEHREYIQLLFWSKQNAHLTFNIKIFTVFTHD